MKSVLIAIFSLVTISAHAGEIAWLNKQQWGNIFLTDDPCNILLWNFPNLKFAFMRNQGKKTDGCYGVKDGKVIMLFVQETPSPLHLTFSVNEFNLLTNKKLQ